MAANDISVSVSVPVGLDSGPQAMLKAAQFYVIDCPEMYEAAADDLKSVKAKYKEIEAKRTEIVKPLNEAVKAVNNLFRAPLEFLTEAETTLKQRLIGYDQEQERKRKAEQERLDAIARAEQARLRAQAEAIERAAQAQREEAERIEREAREKAAAEARAAAAAIAQANSIAARKAAQKAADEAAARAAEEAQARAAENARREAEAQEAAAIAREQAQDAELMPAPIAVTEKPKVAGLSGREKHKARVTDKGAFVRAVAARPELLELVKVDESALNKMAGALKTALAIDGVQVYTEHQLASRS